MDTSIAFRNRSQCKSSIIRVKITNNEPEVWPQRMVYLEKKMLRLICTYTLMGLEMQSAIDSRGRLVAPIFIATCVPVLVDELI